MRTTQTRRVIVPMMLLAVGVWLLQGCLYIPMFNATVGGKEATRYVGESGSGKPLERDLSTSHDVRRMLGNPHFATTDGRFLVYSWLKRKGVMIYPQCFAAEPEDRSFALTFEFDRDGVLRETQIEEGFRMGYLFSPPRGRKFVPFRVTIHQKELELQDRPELLKQFRAATQRSQPRSKLR
ncbi:MAG: hypothetical protein QOE14_624 [Humisphaera sp.]|nr:hypothetical protein [Humisphaera sp.]